MKKAPISGIYRITQISTGLFYIGSSIDISTRWRQHKYAFRKPESRSTNPRLTEAWNICGESDFIFEIIETCEPTKAILLEREQHYIDTLKPALNIAPKAGSRLGSKASAETKAKMSTAMVGKNVGKIRSAETREKLRETATNISDETREKMAAAKRGRKFSEETKAKMRAAKVGVRKNPDSTALTQKRKNENRLERLRVLAESHSTDNVKVNYKLRKFSDDTVREIMNSGDNDLQLSIKYACSPATIRKIRTRKIYRDVVI